MTRPGLWTLNFVAIALVNFSASLSFILLLLIIPLYALDNFHSSPSEAGLASSIFVIGAVVARLFFGRLIERIGRRRILFGGLILNLVMASLYFATSTFFFLLVVRFLHGMAFGITSATTAAIVANIIPKERRGEGMGYFISLSATLSAAIGPFIGLFTLQNGSYDQIFLICIIFAVLSLATALGLSVPEVKLNQEQLQATREFKLGRLFEIKAIPISIVGAAIYFCYSSVLSFLAVYSKEIAVLGPASFFYVIFSIAILLSRPFTGRVFDRSGANYVMYPAILILAAGIYILSLTQSGFTLLLAAALTGLGLGTIQPSSMAISIESTPAHRTGLATSTYMLFLDASVGVGPVVFGLFIPLIGYRGMYTAAAVLALAAVLIYYLLVGRGVKSRNAGNGTAP